MHGHTVKKCSWGWANLSPETCRADLKKINKTIKLLHVVGCLRHINDARSHKHWVIFITETECVYCAVRTEYLRKIQVNFRNRWGLVSILDHCLRFLWWTKLHWDVFSSEYFCFLLSQILPPFLQTHFMYEYMSFLPQSKMGEIWKPPEKLCRLGNRRTLGRTYFRSVFRMLTDILSEIACSSPLYWSCNIVMIFTFDVCVTAHR